ERDPVPLCRLFLQLFLSTSCQLVVLCTPVVLGWFPGGGEPTRFFETVERREQGSGLDAERPLRHLADPARHAETVKLARCERLENQQVERPLKKAGGRARHGSIEGRQDYEGLPIELSTD